MVEEAVGTGEPLPQHTRAFGLPGRGQGPHAQGRVRPTRPVGPPTMPPSLASNDPSILSRPRPGALLLARNPDAAAWLAAAFKQGSLDGAGSSLSSSSSGAAGRKAAHAAQPASIRKTYWAVVARGEEGEPGAAARTPGRGWLPRSGYVRLAVPSSRETGEALPADTRFRVLHQGPHLAWLELRPSTVGCRRQLSPRMHRLILCCTVCSPRNNLRLSLSLPLQLFPPGWACVLASCCGLALHPAQLRTTLAPLPSISIHARVPGIAAGPQAPAAPALRPRPGGPHPWG